MLALSHEADAQGLAGAQRLQRSQHCTTGRGVADSQSYVDLGLDAGRGGYGRIPPFPPR